MTAVKPAVYLFTGEDEFAISQEIAHLKERLGEPSLASLNTSALDGRKATLEEIQNVVLAMPVLLERRLVILERAVPGLTTPAARKRFLALLDQIPNTTALVLVEYQALTSDKERKQNKIHWLEKWVDQAGNKGYKRFFPLPKNAAMEIWIQDQVAALNGRMTSPAAAMLASMVGEDTRTAYHEVEKLLAYVGYQRAVEVEDVDNLAVSVRQEDIFGLVDAIGDQDGRRSLRLLHRLLGGQDARMIFGMVARQFRLLLQARDVLDRSGTERDVVSQTGMNPYVAGKVVPQARHFTMPRLIAIIHRLLEIDEAVKTGQMEIDIALDTFITSVTIRT